LSSAGQGSVEISAIGFSSLNNTRTVSAGTLTLAYWDELNGPSSVVLSAPVAASDTTLSVSTPVSAEAGDVIQIEAELMSVVQALSNGSAIQVARGSHEGSAVDHAAQSAVYLLLKKTYIMPFARDFFGSLASGSYAFPVAVPDIRVGAAELFVTNSQGNSPVGRQSITATTDFGLRTLSGGQLSIQVEGPLAIETDAAPLLLVDSAHSVRDVYAIVKDAPTGAPVVLQVTQNGQLYCQLTIPVSRTISNVVDGFALGPLQSKAQIGLDITAVTQTADTTPGRDLTVTIRL
jgi:hypothetical protein